MNNQDKFDDDPGGLSVRYGIPRLTQNESNQESNPMNGCDYDHQTENEVRLLPIGGGGNVIVCHQHYRHEMDHRREVNRRLTVDSQMPLPGWNTLKVYGND